MSELKSVIQTIKSYVTNRQKSDEKFDEMVALSVYATFEHGDARPVNLMLQGMKGRPGVKALLTFYLDLIPFHHEKNAELGCVQFTKSNRELFKVMGKVGTGDVPVKVRQKVIDKPWHEYSRETSSTTAYKFQPSRLKATVLGMFTKANESGGITLDALLESKKELDALFAEQEQLIKAKA